MIRQVHLILVLDPVHQALHVYVRTLTSAPCDLGGKQSFCLLQLQEET
jgi:hypothetical protein